MHDADGPGRPVEIPTRVPGRLTHFEDYPYAADGSFLERRGLRDGDPGRQVDYSRYRLRFGSFAAIGVKALFGVQGFALTVIAATGISIRLAPRRVRTWLDDARSGVVWGTPADLAVAAGPPAWARASPPCPGSGSASAACVAVAFAARGTDAARTARAQTPGPTGGSGGLRQRSSPPDRGNSEIEVTGDEHVPPGRRSQLRTLPGTARRRVGAAGAEGTAGGGIHR